MLDGARSGAGMQENGQSDYGGDFGGGAPEPSARAKGGSGKSFDKALDDEIPF